MLQGCQFTDVSVCVKISEYMLKENKWVQTSVYVDLKPLTLRSSWDVSFVCLCRNYPGERGLDYVLYTVFSTNTNLWLRHSTPSLYDPNRHTVRETVWWGWFVSIVILITYLQYFSISSWTIVFRKTSPSRQVSTLPDGTVDHYDKFSTYSSLTPMTSPSSGYTTALLRHSMNWRLQRWWNWKIKYRFIDKVKKFKSLVRFSLKFLSSGSREVVEVVTISYIVEQGQVTFGSQSVINHKKRTKVITENRFLGPLPGLVTIFLTPTQSVGCLFCF